MDARYVCVIMGAIGESIASMGGAKDSVTRILDRFEPVRQRVIGRTSLAVLVTRPSVPL